MRTVSSIAVLALAVVLVLVLFADQGVLAGPQYRRRNNGGRRLGANPCTFGPSYWCDNHDQARECDTVNWCVQKGMLYLD